MVKRASAFAPGCRSRRVLYLCEQVFWRRLRGWRGQTAVGVRAGGQQSQRHSRSLATLATCPLPSPPLPSLRGSRREDPARRPRTTALLPKQLGASTAWPSGHAVREDLRCAHHSCPQPPPGVGALARSRVTAPSRFALTARLGCWPARGYRRHRNADGDLARDHRALERFLQRLAARRAHLARALVAAAAAHRAAAPAGSPLLASGLQGTRGRRHQPHAQTRAAVARTHARTHACTHTHTHTHTHTRSRIWCGQPNSAQRACPGGLRTAAAQHTASARTHLFIQVLAPAHDQS